MAKKLNFRLVNATGECTLNRWTKNKKNDLLIDLNM